MDCIVVRSFTGPEGRRFVPGERVDASDWKNSGLLLEQHFMRVAEPTPALPRPSGATKRKAEEVVAPAVAAPLKKKKKKRVMAGLDD